MRSGRVGSRCLEVGDEEDTGTSSFESADETGVFAMMQGGGGSLRAKVAVGLLSVTGLLLLLAGAADQWPGRPPAPSAATSQELAKESGQLSQLQALAAPVTMCPGSSFVGGPNLGNKKLVNTKMQTKDGLPATEVEVLSGAVVPHLGGRTYFADWCSEDSGYDNNAYMAVPLLGKTLQFTVHLAGAGCGCNVAFYLTSMKQNTDPTVCKDYYCDANSVCGVRCDEIDIMEANSRVWRSTLHLAEDNTGAAAGFGGTGPHTQTWTSAEYGPGGRCIDTARPFEVHAHFPARNGTLQGLMVDLSQEGSSCGLTATVGMYKFAGRDGLAELSKSLAAGMVPIISYWTSDNLLWLDGQDVNGDAPCAGAAGSEEVCPETAPRIWGMQVKDFTGFIHPSTMHLQPTTPAPAPVSVAVDPLQAASSQVPNALAAQGWRKVERAGQVYYYNTNTMQATWKLPPSVVAV